MITFNGVSSNSIGVIVERIPNRNVPVRRTQQQEVPGKNGNVLLHDDSFPNVEQAYEVYFSGATEGLPAVARAAAEWLCSPKEYKTLWDSYDPNVFHEAVLASGFEIENALNKLGRATIVFSCKPQKYLTSGRTPTSETTLTNPTPFEARPLIKVSGEGTITIGGRTITVLEEVEDFEIDCETMEADDNTKIFCMDFPVLVEGENTVTLDEGITAFEITPRWWTI